jgi:hypothetical protein
MVPTPHGNEDCHDDVCNEEQLVGHASEPEVAKHKHRAGEYRAEDAP